MLQWLSGYNDDDLTQAFSSVTAGLQELYKEKLLPLEKDHDFHSFYDAALTDADFASKPMVLLMGQYSTGKSTFIRHLIQRDYPGLRIGPEPTTDKFVVVLQGETDQVIPGNAFVVDTSLPFTQLSHFGNSFLARLEGSKLDSPVLENLILIDTPGVLAGEKQRINRGYEFESVIKWFSDRVDMIILLFDVAKLDISDELRRIIQAARGNDHKIHIVLNKSDGVTTQQLLRVYGSLMWSLGKVIDTPEVSRVYVGSFWDGALQNETLRDLFEREENDLYTKLAQLPHNAAIRKVNDLIKRARLAKVHAILLDYLYSQMPYMWGHSKEQERMITNLIGIYREIAREKNLPLGDFPEPRMMQERLKSMDFSTFKPLDPARIQAVDELLFTDLPKLLQLIPEEQARSGVQSACVPQVGGAPSPFAVLKVGGVDEKSAFQSQWLVAPDSSEYENTFENLGPVNGKITGTQAKEVMIESHLPSNVLHSIWGLADTDNDGMLNLQEFALAMHFVKMKLNGLDLPSSLPPDMVPLSST